jgi:hypothetical protein
MLVDAEAVVLLSQTARAYAFQVFWCASNSSGGGGGGGGATANKGLFTRACVAGLLAKSGQSRAQRWDRQSRSFGA